MYNIIFKGLKSYWFEPNEETKAAKYVTLVNETIPYHMDKFENIVGENNGYFVNGKVDNIIMTYLHINDLIIPNLHCIIDVLTSFCSNFVTTCYSDTDTVLYLITWCIIYSQSTYLFDQRFKHSS